MKLIEKMARAIDPAAWLNFESYCRAKEFDLSEERTSLAIRRSRKLAVDALKAMREPSETMVQAGHRGHCFGRPDEMFRTMIDAAISEAETD